MTLGARARRRLGTIAGGAAVAVLAGLAPAGAVPAAADDTVAMPDAALLACLNEHLGAERPADQPVTLDELAAFSGQLRCGSRGIADLTGLEHASSLGYLELDANEIEDLSPLGSLAGLFYLDASENRISDIGALSGLPELRSVLIRENLVTDVQPLAHLDSWSELDLSENAITDISPLRGYGGPDTAWVDFSAQQVAMSATVGVPAANPIIGTDGEPVPPEDADSYQSETNSFLFSEVAAAHPETWRQGDWNVFSGTLLWEVTEAEPAEADVPDEELRACINDELGQPAASPITTAQLASLTVLDCDWYWIADLTGIESATALEVLRVPWSLDIGDSERGIEPLAGLTSLVELDLEMTNVRDLSPLAGLHGLRTLYLDSNPIDDAQLARLSALDELQVLSITDDPAITDLAPLASLSGLRELYAQFVPVTSVEPLAGLTGLEVLYLNYGAAITDLSPLAGLTNLTELGIDDQEVRLPDVMVGSEQANPVRGPDGLPVGSDSEFYDALADAFVFTSAGSDVATSWETEVTIGGVTATFSGTLVRDVLAAPVPSVAVDPAELTDRELADTGVRITGTGFPAGAVVTLSVSGAAAGTATADTDGEVSFAFAAELGVGEHPIVLAVGTLSAETTLTVTAAVRPDAGEELPPRALPATGGPAPLLGLVSAVLLIALGIGLLRARRA